MLHGSSLQPALPTFPRHDPSPLTHTTKRVVVVVDLLTHRFDVLGSALQAWAKSAQSTVHLGTLNLPMAASAGKECSYRDRHFYMHD